MTAGTIVFSHANGFPAGTYRRAVRGLARGRLRGACDRDASATTRPIPVTQQLAAPARPAGRTSSSARRASPAFLVGHSLGGCLSVLAASRRPDLARGVVLLDSPLITGWRAHGLQRGQGHRAGAHASRPGSVSQRRREHWPSARGVHTSTSRPSTRSRAGIPRVLRDYIGSRLRERDGQDAASRSSARSRPTSTTRCRTTSPACCGAIRCSARWPSSRGTQSAEVRQVGMRGDARGSRTSGSSWIEGIAPVPDGAAGRDRGRGAALIDAMARRAGAGAPCGAPTAATGPPAYNRALPPRHSSRTCQRPREGAARHDQVRLRHRRCGVLPGQGHRVGVARRDPRIARPQGHPHQARSVPQRRSGHDDARSSTARCSSPTTAPRPTSTSATTSASSPRG